MKDFHCHILPGLDDGAKTPEEAEKMLQEAASSGVSVLAATSHYLPETEKFYDEKWEQVKELAKRCSIELLQGMEYDVAHLADVPKERLRTIGNTGYLLVDMNCNYIFHGMTNLFFELKLAGFRIIFAHPERMLPVEELKKLMKLLRENHIYVQLDSGSLTGRYGTLARKNALVLLDGGGCHFLWNDAHHEGNFLHDECREIVEKRCGSGVFELLTEENPAALLAGEELYPAPGRKTFWERLFRR